MQLNPDFILEIEDDLMPVAFDVATASALAFYDHVSRGPRSGNDWTDIGAKAISAARGEYIQEQEGEYKDSIEAIPLADGLDWLVGVFGVLYAIRLELGDEDFEAYEPVYMNMLDPDTIRRELEALMKYDRQ